jgi:RNA polymerase primary sigma factor
MGRAAICVASGRGTAVASPRRPFDSATGTMQQFTDPRSSVSPQRGGSVLLQSYLDRASHYPLLTAAQEREATLAIQRLLVAIWEALLADREERIHVLSRVPEVLRAHASDELDALAQAEDAASVLAVASVLAASDLDREVLAPIVASLAERRDAWARRARHAHRRWLAARNRFACTFLRFVVAMAARVGRNSWALEDRVQEGNLGLLKAIDRFDPERGVRFSTYAAWWIRHAIIRALTDRARTVRVPSHLHCTFMKVRRARVLLRTEWGREASVAELAAHLGISMENITRADAAMALRTVGIDRSDEDDGDMGEASEIACADDLDWNVEADAARTRALAEEAWPLLDEKERDILTLRFGLGGNDPWSLEAIGDKYERSHERIRQLQNLALAKLRVHVESSATTTWAVL